MPSGCAIATYGRTYSAFGPSSVVKAMSPAIRPYQCLYGYTTGMASYRYDYITEALAARGLPRSSSPTAYGATVPMSRPLVPDLWPTPSAFGGCPRCTRPARPLPLPTCTPTRRRATSQCWRRVLGVSRTRGWGAGHARAPSGATCIPILTGGLTPVGSCHLTPPLIPPWVVAWALDQ
ncbi:hypothetical protein BDV93DRAFT_562348 [Ceratobasidium sp. AG-I]|nr:hypothetical protein BDV93DRAFT_562348 [Ceratobasidium sp. AG-I]